MNIAMILSTPLPPTEGIGFYCTNLARELVRGGHAITLITRGGRQTRTMSHPDGYRVIHAAFFPVYPFHVHLHGVFVQRLVDKYVSDASVFHMHTPLVPAIRTTLPIVTTVHTPIKADARSIEMVGPVAYLAKAQAPVSVQLERRLLGSSRAVTAVARSVAEELGEYSIDPASVHVLGNGTDAAYFAPADEVLPGEPNLLYAGRLAHRKGLFDLVDAFEILATRHSALKLILAGSGPLDSELRRRVARAGLLGRVSFLGHISDRGELRRLYRQATAYVQASHYEGLPTSLLEAMSCARPVVATAVSGHLDAVDDNVSGLLVPAKDPQRLAGTIDTILQDAGVAGQLGRAARAVVLERFTWPAITRRFVDLYEDVTR